MAKEVLAIIDKLLDSAEKETHVAALSRRDEALRVARDALEAVVARINGEWDNPVLVAFGPLGNLQDDILRIAKTALDNNPKS